MVVFGMRCALGIGDIIFTHNILENEKHKFDKIIVNPRWDLIDNFRSGSVGYRTFIDNFIRRFFTDPKYLINVGGNYGYYTAIELVHQCGFKISKPDLQSVFKYTDPGLEKPYIVVFTKVRDLHVAYWNNVRTRLFALLNSISKTHKIILLGEKIVEMNPEYLAFGNLRVYSLYQDLISSGVPFVDYTVPQLGITVPNLDTIIRDCSIMSFADCVITVGVGGGFVLACGSAKKTISFCHDDYNMMNYAFKPGDGVNIRLNEATFLAEVENFAASCEK